ncbi:Rossmann-like and DUF2520 domain-containing protein [Maribacter antarcticus]|uniref:Rossmann-like and DUF2520 domain-containing protein n=1 Tax=Maribacter antarcticus TaxID=505250 RepID=UPI000478FE4E|nr:Rossmann-like and DUF2520 domain-containing protein [Maribacter antarcticus]
MISITILGTGNVAQNLFEAFLLADGVEVLQVVGRAADRMEFFKHRTTLVTYEEKLDPTDIYIIAVTDDAIREVSDKIVTSGLVVHTSGAVGISMLETHERQGVFYPIQTFTKGRILDFFKIPLCIEATNENDLKLLHRLGSSISSNVVPIASDKRRALHVSAVFVNNFTNYMYTIGAELCKENQLDFSLLKPLINETVEKLDFLDSFVAQTGPARRGDLQTLHTHLSQLKSKKHREIYTLLSNSIKATYPIKKDKS